jgi:hypothetical protein
VGNHCNYRLRRPKDIGATPLITGATPLNRAVIIGLCHPAIFLSCYPRITMAGLFNNLSDIDSAEVDFDSDLDGLLDDFDDSSSEDFYSENGDEEDPLGPDLEAPESPTSSPTTSPTTSPASSSISLPIHHPKPIRPPISLTSTTLTLQAFEALTSTTSLAST